MGQQFIKLDNDESAFFIRQLTSIKTKTYDVRYPELKARQFIPVSNEAGPGASVILYRQYDMIGIAKIIAAYGSDLPRADVKGKEFTANIKSLGASYGYTIQEIRAARQAGLPLEQRKANAAKRAILRLEDKLALLGDSDNALVGLLSNANVPEVAIPADGTGSSTLWSTKTATQMVRDVNLLVNQIVVTTFGVEEPNTVLMPIGQYNLFSTAQMPNINMTALQFLLANSPFIKEVQPWTLLAGAGTGASDVMLCYNKSPDKLTMEVPQDFEQFPVQEHGLEFEVSCHSRFGGVLIYYPLSLAKTHGL